nr:MAG TPA: hypothetical protein [Microviridae sp.]
MRKTSSKRVALKYRRVIIHFFLFMMVVFIVRYLRIVLCLRHWLFFMLWLSFIVGLV